MNNQTSEATIKSFTDLQVWQEGHQLVLATYATTKTFPYEEIFGLTSQLQRAAVSITSNIAEGFSRQSLKEKRQFYYNALGSLTELQNQLVIAKDLKYVNTRRFNQLGKQTVIIHKMLCGLVKTAKNQDLNSIQNTQYAIRDTRYDIRPTACSIRNARPNWHGNDPNLTSVERNFLVG